MKKNVLRQYVNNFHKQLQIGKHIKFDNGFFETEDTELQALIESNNAFGVHIHFKDTPEEMARLGLKRQEDEAAEKARKRTAFLAEIKAEEDEVKKEKAEKEKEEATEKKKEKAGQKLRAADKVL